MEIRYVTGDMFNGHEDAIVHGCNARGVMGSGVARIVHYLYPEAYNAYYAEFARNGLHLGQVIWAQSNGKLIGNAITQKDFGRKPDKVYVSYDGIVMAIQAVNTYAKENGLATVAFPRIGAGLGGGDWETIARIITDESHEFQPVVYTLDTAPPSEMP